MLITRISSQWRTSALFFLLLALLTAQSLGVYWFALLTLVFIVFCAGIVLAIHDRISKEEIEKESVLYELRSSEDDSQTFTQGLSMVESSIQDRINTKQREYNFLMNGGPRELTGIKQLDDVINKMLDLCIQDFIQGWYSKLNSDQAFLIETRILIERCITTASQKVQAADWFAFLTKRILQEVGTHIRVYKAAEQQMLAQSLRQNEKQDDNSRPLSLEDWFFKMEQQRTQDSFQAVCTCSTSESEYHRLMVDMLMLFLMPENEYDCVLLRDLLKEVFTIRVMRPAFNYASKPSTINYMINSRSPSNTISARAFSKYIESAYIPVADLRCLISFFDKEIQDLTRKGSSDREHSHLESLKGLRSYCRWRVKQLTDESNKPELASTSFKGRAMLSLIYSVELSDSVLEFLSRSQETRREAQFLEDVLTFTDSYKFVDATDGTSTQQSMRENAMMIFSNYLCSSSDTFVQLEAKILDNLTKLLFSQSMINNDIFKEAIANVCHRLQELGSHQAFLNHCNTEGNKYDEELIRSSKNSLDHSAIVLNCTSIKSNVSEFSIESDSNLLSRSIVQYKLGIECTLENGEYYRWSIQKRFSDFDALHKAIVEKGIYLPPDLTLPQKFGIFTASTQVLAEARRKAIETYLTRLLDLTRALPGLRDELAKFFAPHCVSQNDSSSSSSNSGGGGGASKLSSGSNEQGQTEAPITDSESDQLIKRILELLREIFDLKREEDQSFYISLSSIILQSIIKTTKGEKLHRKLYESYSEYTDPSFLATLLTMLTDSIWPQGIYRGTSPQTQDASKKVRKNRLGILSRIRLLNSLPEELVTFLNSKVTDKGMNRLYSMVQSKRLNKRFIYVIIESALEFILPNTIVKQEFVELRALLSTQLGDL